MAKRWTYDHLKVKAAQTGLTIQPQGGDEEDTVTLDRVQAGTEAQEAGDEWQKRLDNYHASLMRRGLMIKIFRQYPPMKATYLMRRLVFVVQQGEKGPCDYALIFADGRAGVFDAKSTGKQKQFTWPKEQAHQLAELRHLHFASDGFCPAFALVEWRAWREVRVHPIDTIKNRAATTGTLKDRTVYRAEGLLVQEINWLPVVKNHWKIR